MITINYTRLVNGLLLLIGLAYFKPIAYLVALMMLIAGLTNYCLMERLFAKVMQKNKNINMCSMQQSRLNQNCKKK